MQAEVSKSSEDGCEGIIPVFSRMGSHLSGRAGIGNRKKFLADSKALK